LDAGSLSSKGSVNLVNEALDMHMTAVLGSAISKTVGGTGIGGFLNTALSNSQGELVLPVIVTGTLAHPVLAPDVQQLAEMKLKHLLPTTGNPSQMTSGLVGSVLGGVLGQKNQNQNQKQQQNPINSILNSLGKKKR
jgi:outer membrane lipoprotein SlyB